MDLGSVCLSVLAFVRLGVSAEPRTLDMDPEEGGRRTALVTPVERKVGLGEYTVMYAEAGKGENLVFVANSRYLSGRYGDGFDKRGHSVRGDLGIVQYELSRHSSLRFEFLQMD